MGLGLSKDFVIFIIISIIIGIGLENYQAGLTFFLLYCIIKVVWKFLTN